MTAKQPKAKKTFCIIAILIAFAAVLLFFIWVKDKTHTHFVSIFFAALSLAGVAALLASILIPEKEFTPGERTVRRDRIMIILLVVITRIVTCLLGYCFLRLSDGIEGGLIETLARTWRIGYGIDAPSYLGIAENGYVTSGDAMYHIVFLPFYPLPPD